MRDRIFLPADVDRRKMRRLAAGARRRRQRHMGHSHWRWLRQPRQQRRLLICAAKCLDRFGHVDGAATADTEQPVALIRTEHRQACLHLLCCWVRREAIELHHRHSAVRQFFCHATARQTTAADDERLHHAQPRQQRWHIATHRNLRRRTPICEHQRTAGAFKNDLFQKRSPLRHIHALIIPQPPVFLHHLPLDAAA